MSLTTGVPSLLIAAALCTAPAWLSPLYAQPAGAPPPAGPRATAEQSAPFDLTGYWVSVITEDWRWRMLTPPHGDYASVPLNAAGRRVADAWTTAEDGSCLAYGAAGLMRMPTRVHITWSDPNTLQLQSDWGQQTRLFHFVPMPGPAGVAGPASGAGDAGGAPSQRAAGPPSLQGHSVAIWERTYPAQGGFGRRRGPVMPLPGGDLKVVTTDLSPGWLRRNGVPYGGHTVLTEYYQDFTDPLGRQWFDVTTQVTDPEYLMAPFITSSDFRHEPDGAHWAPHPCKPIEGS